MAGVYGEKFFTPDYIYITITTTNDCSITLSSVFEKQGRKKKKGDKKGDQHETEKRENEDGAADDQDGDSKQVDEDENLPKKSISMLKQSTNLSKEEKKEEANTFPDRFDTAFDFHPKYDVNFIRKNMKLAS